MGAPLRHMGIVAFGADDLLALLTAAGKGPVIVRCAGIPRDAALITIDYYPERRVFGVVLEGPGLPSVHPGEALPWVGGPDGIYAGIMPLRFYPIPSEVI